MTTLAQASGALEGDSAIWSTASSDLGTAASNAEGLNVSDWDWPVRGSLEVYYRDLKTKIVDLLTVGSTETGELGNYLIEVRNTLNAVDQSRRDDLDGLWDF